VENDEFVIKLDVAGRIYKVSLKRGEEQEESLMRKGTKRLKQYVVQYTNHFAKSAEERDILAMIAIQLAMEVVDLEEQVVSLEEKNDTKPFIQKILQLTETLDNYLTDK